MIEVMTIEQYNELLLKDAYELLMKAKSMVEQNEHYCHEAESLIDKAEEKLQIVCDCQAICASHPLLKEVAIKIDYEG